MIRSGSAGIRAEFGKSHAGVVEARERREEAIAQVAREGGHERPVEEAREGGREGERPAVILMDVQLPGTDGLTLTRAIRSDARFVRLPIVAVTAYAMEADREAALGAGCDAFVAKPIDVRALGELVHALMRRGAEGAE